MERLEENAFAGLVGVKQLNLARNRLELIDSKAFRALRQLDTLDLKANRLRESARVVSGCNVDGDGRLAEFLNAPLLIEKTRW